MNPTCEPDVPTIMNRWPAGLAYITSIEYLSIAIAALLASSVICGTYNTGKTMDGESHQFLPPRQFEVVEHDAISRGVVRAHRLRSGRKAQSRAIRYR